MYILCLFAVLNFTEPTATYQAARAGEGYQTTADYYKVAQMAEENFYKKKDIRFNTFSFKYVKVDKQDKNFN